MNESTVVIARARVVKDPELRYSKKQTPFLNLRVVYKGGTDDIFINALLTGKAAEIFKLNKGDLVYLDGSLDESVWTARGEQKRSFYISIKKLLILKKKDSPEGPPQRDEDFIDEDDIPI